MCLNEKCILPCAQLRIKTVRSFCIYEETDDVFHFDLKLEKKRGGPHRESYDNIYRNGFRLIEKGWMGV